MALMHVTKNDFEEKVTNTTGVVLVDFYADWCGPCKMLAPVVEALAEEMKDIAVYKVNVDEENELAVRFRVMSIPTLIVFKDGVQVKTHMGLCSKAELMEMLSV